MRTEVTFYRPTWVEINLQALVENLAEVRQLIGPACGILAQVKANAYGHGLIRTAQTLEAEGVDFFGVASLDEARALRQYGIHMPILVQTELLGDETAAVFEYDVRPTLCSLAVAEALQREAEHLGRRVKFHLKVDTGMGRVGIWHEEAAALLEQLQRYDRLELEGLYTHLPSAEEDTDFTGRQLACFTAVVDDLRAQGIHPAFIHAANSAAILQTPSAYFNLVRPGLMLYGLSPLTPAPSGVTLHPVLSWKTRITFIKTVPAGRTISYGRTYTTPQTTRIATLPVGYGDGFFRRLSNTAQVLVRGVRCPVVGRVTMDQLMVDLGCLPDVVTGEEVVLIGAQGASRITAEEFAAWAGTIPYEVTTSIAARIPRLYHRPIDQPSTALSRRPIPHQVRIF